MGEVNTTRVTRELQLNVFRTRQAEAGIIQGYKSVSSYQPARGNFTSGGTCPYRRPLGQVARRRLRTQCALRSRATPAWQASFGVTWVWPEYGNPIWAVPCLEKEVMCV